MSRLIEPRRARWGEVEMDVGMTGEPEVVLRLVRAEVVEHDVDLLAGIIGDDLVQKGQELLATAALGVHPADRPREDVERGEERRRTVPLVLMTHPSNSFAVGEHDIALRPFQGLNRRLFIDA